MKHRIKGKGCFAEVLVLDKESAILPVAFQIATVSRIEGGCGEIDKYVAIELRVDMC
ncbi:hypothetical protein L0657_01000 [Dyadobacter sp. CY345]|uniref:hypothetical protein n=1 Tax=Dyadobacter sp. CY345 TaxID=2909335 RepID=UPI001F3FA213|nr:hypothetical protein [Dyadobacter sp. CY345]MCF2442514.1 hypothetical protein [Dyadobacter sp. CY345]